jgi:putative PIN family toxin of toxin-antitoxin system
MHEVVLDTNVLVAALRSKRGSPYRLLHRIGGGDWRLNISVALALEYEDVLKRSHVLPGFSETEVDEFLDYLFSVARLEPTVRRKRPSLRDPDDERILEVAAQCGAMMVTHNTRDLRGPSNLGFR